MYLAGYLHFLYGQIMNLLFIADIHIKLGQKNVPISWAKNRFRMFLEQLDKMQDKADIVVLGGDIFDRLPDNMDEVALFFDLVHIFRKPTIIYSGNHEALKRDTTFLTVLRDCTGWVNPHVQIVDDFTSILDGRVDIIPYNKLKEVYPETMKARVVCTHVRGEIPPHVKSEIDLNLLNRWEVVLAGDLHSYGNCQRNILYPGSPFTTSFHRNPVETGAILLDLDTLSHEWLKFDLPQLLRVTIAAGEDKLEDDYNHIVYEVEGNLEELSLLEDDELVAKKLVKRIKDTQLILSSEMTLEEEMREYLLYIMQLPENVADDIIKEFHSHLDKLEL